MAAELTLVALTPEQPVADEAERLLRLADEGFRWLHLRHPGLDEASMRRLLDSLDPSLLPLVRLHAHPRLVTEYGLGGLHLGRRCPDPQGVTDLSRSLHTPAELAAVRPGEYRYVTYSPVFASISKPGYAPASEAMPAPPCAVPVVALGGVTRDRLEPLARLGYAGAAMLGALWH